MKPIPLEPQVVQAFLNASGRWTGCEWSTRFGKTELNLQGLKASQALLLARATAGQEAADWRAAVHWLVEVERQALEAEREAQMALDLARYGHWEQALHHARRACQVEKKYHPHPLWQALYEAIAEAALTASN